jgi:hypothetical protein
MAYLNISTKDVLIPSVSLRRKTGMRTSSVNLVTKLLTKLIDDGRYR